MCMVSDFGADSLASSLSLITATGVMNRADFLRSDELLRSAASLKTVNIGNNFWK